MTTPTLDQLNLVVHDMGATLAFYRRLGVPVGDDQTGPHVGVRLAGGVRLEFDTEQFAAQWDRGRDGAGDRVVIGFSLPSRQAVDETYRALVAAGSRGHQPPYDAFWGARYAIVDDPDSRAVGLMSPVDESRKFWPPGTPPPPEG